MRCRDCRLRGGNSWCRGGRGLYDRRSHTRLRGRSRRRPHPGRFRGGFLRFFLGFGCRFRLRFGFGNALNLLSYLFGDVGRN